MSLRKCLHCGKPQSSTYAVHQGHCTEECAEAHAARIMDKETALTIKWAPELANLRAQLAALRAENERLEKDQQWLDPGAVELIKAFGSFSIERLPDWNFAVGIDGAIYGIGMTVFDAISSAASQIDKIKETRKEGGE